MSIAVSTPPFPSDVASPAAATPSPALFQPGVTVEDPLAAHWLRQVTLRLRREICWLRHERGGSGPQASGQLPPFYDRLQEALDLARYAAQKRAFFAGDETAAYLSALIAEPPPTGPSTPERGSFSWVVDRLRLDEAHTFVLALALAPVLDPAAGTVFAAVLNEPGRAYPTLALAQRLWDSPDDLLSLTDPAHPLRSAGLLVRPGREHSPILDWDAPLGVPGILAPVLLYPPAPLPALLRPLSTDARLKAPPGADLVRARLLAAPGDHPRLQPLVGPPGAALADAAAALARDGGREIFSAAPGAPVDPAHLCTLAWLCGVDLFLEPDPVSEGTDGQFSSLPALPVTLFLGVRERSVLPRLPRSILLPPLEVPALTHLERRDLWWRVLGRDCLPELAAAVDECARRFRCGRETILAAGRSLAALGRPPTAADLFAACRSELAVDLGGLAQPVTPRFEEAELMLPPKQTRQIGEIITGMQSLTEVHYGWGTARAWNECGLSALFAGPPGTGKTMSAEVIAAHLGLPLFRIDLSQVVNKYIGETEKNLHRLFDAADASDVVLFFDEADALFGKRTEVKDAHDRYANLEVSYLLERMERFKGLAILATNRKKDLDEAFLRRLRYVVDFPLPGVEERLRIWRGLLPADVDCSDLDLTFLAQRLALAGGHLRSIVFNACLQSTGGRPRRLTMAAVLGAAKREFDKLERPLSRDQLGPYAAVVESLENPS